MPRPGRLSARLFNEAGSALDRPKTAWPPGTPGSFTNRRRTAFHAAPGISRAFRQTIRAPAPPRRQRKPVYPWWDGKSMARGKRAGMDGDENGIF